MPRRGRIFWQDAFCFKRGTRRVERIHGFALRSQITQWPARAAPVEARRIVSICHNDGLPARGAVSEAGRPGARFRTGGRINPWPVDQTLDSRSASKNSRVRASGATKRNESSSARRSGCLMAADLPSKLSTLRTWACLRLRRSRTPKRCRLELGESPTRLTPVSAGVQAIPSAGSWGCPLLGNWAS